MNCKTFQEALPEIIETGGNPEQKAHLQDCQVCSDLVQDLTYIAEQARLLLPMRDPNPRVWNNIQTALEREGMVRRQPARFQVRTLNPARWSTPAWAGAIAAVLVLVFGIILFNNVSRESGREVASAQPQSGQAVAQAQFADPDDQRLLQEVAQRAPNMRSQYEENLRSVNAYIADAQKAVEANPQDEFAREHLMQAYQQKALLYDMAVSRSMYQ
jgi:hypothetical protein